MEQIAWVSRWFVLKKKYCQNVFATESRGVYYFTTFVASPVPLQGKTAGGGCTKASIACGNLTPYLCYGDLSRGDRMQEIFQMHKIKFSLRTVCHLLELRCQEQWTNQKPRYKLKSAVVCQQRHCLWWGMTEPPQKKRPNFTDEELRALIAGVISRKEVLFSKFGGKIKFCDYRAIVKKSSRWKKIFWWDW